MLGVHSLTWEEAQLLAGTDPDFHRRDLADAIEGGAYPQWELGVQVFPDTPEETFEGIDLLDPTKIVPEELAPVQAIGLLTLTGNPTNYFAETEQVAFHVGNLVPGIDVTNDPLLQARLFSYVDTQLTRLGGPNFAQIPINRPHAPVNDMLRDGFHQHAVHGGVAPYKPNSLDGGCPFFAGGARDGAFVDVPAHVAESVKTREAPASYDDHFSQVRQFWLSMTPRREGAHRRGVHLRAREVLRAGGQGAPAAGVGQHRPGAVCTGRCRTGAPCAGSDRAAGDLDPSPALSQLADADWPTDGRVIGIVVDPDGDLAGVDAVREAVTAAGMVPLVVGPYGGKLPDGTTVQRTFAATRSVEFDAVVLAGSPVPAADALAVRDSKADEDGEPRPDPRVVLLLQECFRHAKAIGAWGAGVSALELAGVRDAAGVFTGDDPAAVFAEVHTALGAHRVWQRFGTALS